MSEKTKVKKSKSTAKKKSKVAAKKKTATAKKSRASKTVKKTASKKTAKKKASNNSSGKVKSLEENLEKLSPPLEEKYFNSNLEVEESLENQKVEDVVGDSAGSNENSISVNLSNSLIRKLKNQASDEGVSLEDFVSELLAESVVLRAWEIVERKNQMRSTPSQNVGNRSGNNSSGNSRGNGNRKGRMSHGRYQSIMDDKATFLEYVRNQERSRR